MKNGVIVAIVGILAVLAVRYYLDAPEAVDGSGAQVEIYRDATPLGPGVQISPDDALEIRIQSDVDGSAFLAMVDGKGKLTSKPQDLYAARQQAANGQVVKFPQVSAPSGAEKFVVFICPASEVTLVGGVLSNFANLSDIKNALPSCRFAEREFAK